MTPKEFLRQYEIAMDKVERLKTEYESETEKIDNVRSALSGDGIPHATGKSNPTEAEAVRLAEKADALHGAVLRAVELQRQVFETVDLVPGVEGEILFARYIQLKHWREVAETVHMSDSGMFSAHDRALKIIDQILKNRSKSE